jgi:hypothetical protein
VRLSRQAFVLLLLLMGIVLSPLRAVAATVPVLFACDAVVRPTTTTRVDTGSSLRPNAEQAPITAYGDALFGYDTPSRLLLLADGSGPSVRTTAPSTPSTGVSSLRGRSTTLPRTTMTAEAADTFVYRLVDESGDAVYYGISNDPARGLAEHAADGAIPFNGMQVISAGQPLAQARALESSLIQQAVSEGRTIYNVARNSRGSRRTRDRVALRRGSRSKRDADTVSAEWNLMNIGRSSLHPM